MMMMSMEERRRQWRTRCQVVPGCLLPMLLLLLLRRLVAQPMLARRCKCRTVHNPGGRDKIGDAAAVDVARCKISVAVGVAAGQAAAQVPD